MPSRIARREILASCAGALYAARSARAAVPKDGFRLAFFNADITPPVGTPMLSGVRSRSVADPLFAKGLVLLGAREPVVLAALDWCEVRNESYERWRSVLAKAAGTTRQRVLVSCVHQHDAPYVDIVAQRLLKAHRADGDLCDPKSSEKALQNVSRALRSSLAGARAITQIGCGEGRVDEVASNRRYVTADGKVSFGRTSATRDAAIRAMPVGLVDPMLKTLSFWAGDRPVAAVHCFATHPMSYYGKGDLSADFPGIARARRQMDFPDVPQIYLSGCAGDIMAGAFNDGDPKNRPILADRLYKGMAAAWEATKKHPLESIGFRCGSMKFAPRETPGFSLDEMKKQIASPSEPFRVKYQAALGLSWRKRLDAGPAIDVPSIDFGAAHLVLMPAESFVQYQLWAQQMRPDSFVMTPAYGECAPGYIPTAESAAEGYDDHYCWVAFPDCERVMRGALDAALRPARQGARDGNDEGSLIKRAEPPSSPQSGH